MANEFKLSYTASDINARLGKIDSLATKSELPKNVSDLVNDSDFATKQYIQDYAQPKGDYALKSDIPGVDLGDYAYRMLPSVTSADNGKFLRVVNGAWVAAFIPYAEEATF